MPWRSAARRKPPRATSDPAPRAAHHRDGQPEPDPGERGEQRVREGPHDAPQDEQLGQPLLAVLHELAAEVDDVLAEGEPGAHQARIHDAVDDPVELAPPQQHDEQHPEALEPLLDERCPEDRSDDVGVLGTGQPHGDRDAGVEEQRSGRRTDRTPGEGQDEHPGRLDLVAIEPQERRDHDQQRQCGEECCEQRDLDAEPGLELDRQHRGAEQKSRGDETADDHRTESWPRGAVRRRRIVREGRPEVGPPAPDGVGAPKDMHGRLFQSKPTGGLGIVRRRHRFAA